jgi:hypothetical protein
VCGRFTQEQLVRLYRLTMPPVNTEDLGISASILSCQLTISAQIPAHAVYVNTP